MHLLLTPTVSVELGWGSGICICNEHPPATGTLGKCWNFAPNFQMTSKVPPSSNKILTVFKKCAEGTHTAEWEAHYLSHRLLSRLLKSTFQALSWFLEIGHVRNNLSSFYQCFSRAFLPPLGSDLFNWERIKTFNPQTQEICLWKNTRWLDKKIRGSLVAQRRLIF